MLVVVWTFLHSSSYTSESERKILWYPQIGSRGTQKIYNVTLLCLWWRPQCNFTWNLIHHPLLFNNQPLILCHPSVNVSLQTESSVPFSPCVLSRFSRVWLCDPMDHSPPGSSVREILQSRILKWVSMPSSWDWTHVSYVTCIGSGLPPTSAAWEVPLPPHPPYTVGIWVAVPNPSLLSVPAAFWRILFFFSQARILRPCHIILQFQLGHKFLEPCPVPHSHIFLTPHEPRMKANSWPCEFKD